MINSACDQLTNGGTFRCHAASFKPGTSSGNNCEINYKRNDDDRTDILPSSNAGWEAAQVTRTKVSVN